MMFVVSLLHEFQVFRVEPKNPDVVYWVHPGVKPIRFCVNEKDPVKDILESLYNPYIQEHPHHGSVLIIFGKKKFTVLDQNKTWAEHGILKSVYIIRIRPHMFKPASAA